VIPEQTGIRTRGSLSTAVITLGVLVGVAGLGAGQASAAQVNCGDKIKTDTKLTSNLVNCPNNGIVIGADHVTLNLNGHRIDGNGKPVQHCPKNDPCDIGILDAGRDGVTVKGGKVRQFGLGVLAFKTKRLHLQRLAAIHNHFSGIVITASTRPVIKKALTAADGLTTDQSGMAIFDTDHLRLRNSTLRANGDIGLYDENLDHSRLIGNTFSHNHEAGVILNGNGNLLARNRFLRNGDGVGLGGNDNVLRRNFVAHSSGLGLGIQGGKRNVVAHNRVLNAGDFGVTVAAYGDVADTVVRDNRIRGTGKDGLQVKAVMNSLKRTRVLGNRVFDSGDDGIDVARVSTTLTGNEADRNSDLGIEAVHGVNDGGNNTARGNGDARQCTNVAC
jgi:parallel beta-helix repeat protein